MFGEKSPFLTLHKETGSGPLNVRLTAETRQVFSHTWLVFESKVPLWSQRNTEFLSVAGQLRTALTRAVTDDLECNITSRIQSVVLDKSVHYAWASQFTTGTQQMKQRSLNAPCFRVCVAAASLMSI